MKVINEHFLVILFLVICEVSVGLAGFSTTKISPQPLWNSTYTDKLRQDLLLNYDKFARPAQHDEKTVVKLGMSILHVDVNEIKSTLTVYCWMRMVWTDQKMQWNSSDYGGVNVLHLAEHEIWQPDIFLYNSVTNVPISYYSNTHFLAYPNGEILWVPPAQFTVICNFNLRYWPFDTQKCYMRFGSWTYNGNLIDLQLYNSNIQVELEHLSNNTEWKIIESFKNRSVAYYPCCDEPYPYVDINLTLSRVSPSYETIVITPAFVIMMLTLVSFWLPPHSGEKVVINASTAVIICLFLLYFTQKLPAMGNNTPLIVLFYSSCLYMVSFSMIGSVVVITLARTKHTYSLHWLIKRHLTGKLGQLLGLDNYIKQSSLIPHKPPAEEMRDHQVTDFDDTHSDEHHIVRSTSEMKPSLQHDWILLAAAVDRVLFIIYFFIFAILAIVYSL